MRIKFPGLGLLALESGGLLFRVSGSVSFLVAEFTCPQNVHTFSFKVGNIIPKSVKCIHSATKV